MRGRGIDFEHRFKTSRWAEDLLIRSLAENHGLATVRYGISEVRSESKLVYGTTPYKEPDLLVFRLDDLDTQEKKFVKDKDISSEERAGFESGGRLASFLKKAIVALEVEFSPYKASEMVGRTWTPRTPEKWARRPLKNATPPTAPNIWVKEEDLGKLLIWEKKYGVPIVVVHLFDQESFAVRLRDVEKFENQYQQNPPDGVRLQVTSGIFTKIQSYDRVDAQGAGEKKRVFIITPAASTKVGDVTEVHVEAQLGISSSKKYVSHVLFLKGKLTVSEGFLSFLNSLRNRTR